jgi:hypothetical protein
VVASWHGDCGSPEVDSATGALSGVMFQGLPVLSPGAMWGPASPEQVYMMGAQLQMHSMFGSAARGGSKSIAAMVAGDLIDFTRTVLYFCLTRSSGGRPTPREVRNFFESFGSVVHFECRSAEGYGVVRFEQSKATRSALQAAAGWIHKEYADRSCGALRDREERAGRYRRRF